MMYQDVYNCLCQNTKKWRYTIQYVKPTAQLKIDFQKVDQHAGGMWLIHDTKRRKDNKLQSLKTSIWEVVNINSVTFCWISIIDYTSGTF